MHLKTTMWLAPFICFLAGYFGVRLFLHQNNLNMPLIVGKTTDVALTTLSTINLNPRIIGIVEDPDMEPGTIVNQIPRAQAKVRPHQTVFLVITSRPSVPITEQFIGRPQEQIEKIYGNQKIKPTYVKLPYRLPQGTCFAQYPHAGESSRGSPVIYTAHEIEQKYIVPSLIGAPAAPVIENLKRQGVKITIIGEYADTDITKYAMLHVIDQRPLPGSFITSNSMHKPSLHIRLGK